ncbi:MAG: laccase domain-containing protein [Actinomycetota bacterium]
MSVDVGTEQRWAVGAPGHPGAPEVRVAFGGRHPGLPGQGNVSLVVGDGDPLAARSALLAEVGARLDDAVLMEQVHGSAVAVVGRDDRGRGAREHAEAVGGVDGLVTFDDDVALVVMTADCVPLLVADPRGGIGVAHAGRAGVLAGVVPALLSALAPRDPAALVALLGPAIDGCCYELGAEAAEALAAAHPAAAARTTWGSPSADLRRAVAAQLAAAGVVRVETVGGCTRCAHPTRFSHRAESGAGRQGSVIVRRPAPTGAGGRGVAEGGR